MLPSHTIPLLPYSPITFTHYTTGNLALVHYKQGNYAQALEMYTERLAAIWKFYGNVHPSIADTLNNIAAVHDKQGNYVEAILGMCCFCAEVFVVCLLPISNIVRRYVVVFLFWSPLPSLQSSFFIIPYSTTTTILTLPHTIITTTHSIQRRPGDDAQSVQGRSPQHCYYAAQYCRRIRETRYVCGDDVVLCMCLVIVCIVQ